MIKTIEGKISRKIFHGTDSGNISLTLYFDNINNKKITITFESGVIPHEFLKLINIMPDTIVKITYTYHWYITRYNYKDISILEGR